MPRASQRPSSSRLREDDFEETVSQRVPKQIPRPENFDALVVAMVKAILSLSVKKLPFKRAEICQMCLDGEVKYFPMVFEVAARELKNIYHLDVPEVQIGKDKFQYIAVARHAPVSLQQMTEDQVAQATLLHLVLTFIFMKGGSIGEDSLWNFLGDMNIHGTNDFFGDTRKLIEETFCKQLYLTRTKITAEGTTDTTIEYAWGIRATLEYDKKQILTHTCELLGVPTIQFIHQYEQAFGQLRTDELGDLITQSQKPQSSRAKTQQRRGTANTTQQSAMEVDSSEESD